MKIQHSIRLSLWLFCITLMPLLMGSADLGGGGCSGTVPDNSFSVGGNINGLSGTVVLQNNLGDNLTLTSEGPFTFSTAIADGATYSVTVLTGPSEQTCTATHNTGIINGSNVTNVVVTCSENAYTVGGTVTGLTGTVVLQNNAGDDLSLSADGIFTFSTPVADTAGYDISVLTQPLEQVCVVNDALGTIEGADVTNVEVTCTNSDASISVSDSPLTLLTNGPTGSLTITNDSLTVTASDIISDFTGTALDGNVTETGNTCASLAPQTSCTLTYTPGSTIVAQSDFSISGTNTNTLTAAIEIEEAITISFVSPSSGSASGGTGVTLTGTRLTGATSVTFGGIAATSVNVVDSTTVTAVTPAHAAAAVDVEITTPDGTATLTNGYTYLTTAVGQSAFGGTIACLNGGSNDLVAATADNSTGIQWGGFGTTTSATSTTDGATNTATIVTALGSGSTYAAGLCSNYEVDSQGNTPCEAGNTCYDDWFLPAGNNLTASGQLNCLYTNRVAIDDFAADWYWSSTESAANTAWIQHFDSGNQFGSGGKSNANRVRCVRSFTP